MDASDSATDLLDESTFAGGPSGCDGIRGTVGTFCSAGGVVPGVTDGEPDSTSIEGGRSLLFFRHVDLFVMSFGLGPALGSLDGVPERSSSSIGFGWASDLSPITAISPALGSDV